MSKDNKLEPFGYLCDWGDTQGGMQRIAVYYGERGNGVDDDWNEHPKVYKNLPIFTLDQAEAYTAAKVREALEEAAQLIESRVNQDTWVAAGTRRNAAAQVRSLIK